MSLETHRSEGSQLHKGVAKFIVARLGAGVVGTGYQEECVLSCSGIIAQLISMSLSDTMSNTV